jgi:hypothetical protein
LGLRGDRWLPGRERWEETVVPLPPFPRPRKSGTPTPIDDVEWSLGVGESAATPLLREIADRWPLSTEDKTMLAELFAYQLLRGPRWKDEYEMRTREIFDRYRKEGKLGDTALTDEQLREFEAHLSTDGYRFIRMFAVAPTITSVLASMHWTLVEFDTRLVATCDHPVVLWPLAARSRPGRRAPPAHTTSQAHPPARKVRP